MLSPRTARSSASSLQASSNTLREGGREGERPNRQQEIHNTLINNKYEEEKGKKETQRESPTWPRQGSCEGDRARVSSSLHEF